LLSQTRPADFAGFEEAAGLQDVIGSVPSGADSNMAAPSDAELEQAWQGDIYGLSAPEYTVGPDDLYAMRPVSERLGSGEQDAWKAPPEQGLMGTLSDIWDDPYLPRIEKVRQGIQAVFAPDQYKAEQQHSPFEWGAVATGWAKGIWDTTADTINTANIIGSVINPASALSGVEPVILPRAELDSAELRGSAGAQAMSWIGGFSAMVRGSSLTKNISFEDMLVLSRDAKRSDIVMSFSEELQPLIRQIQEVDSNAIVGMRGSLATGLKNPTKLDAELNRVPFDGSVSFKLDKTGDLLPFEGPQGFDLDVFVISDDLFRSASKKQRGFFKDLGRLDSSFQSTIDSINGSIRSNPLFEGVTPGKKGDLGVRIFKSSRMDRFVKEEEVPFFFLKSE
jgi:hypothetical protein